MSRISYDDDSVSMINERVSFIDKENKKESKNNNEIDENDLVTESKVYEVEDALFNAGQSPNVMKRVLVADDSRFMRGYIKAILKKNDYSVVAEAIDGEDAIDLYKKYKPDMVILDIIMPKKNGIDVLREIKKFDPEAKILICTSMGQKFYIDEAYKLGAMDYIIKPFKIDVVVEAVKKILP